MDTITKQHAMQNGLSHYFTGSPCKNGHLSPRRTATGHCLGCANAATRRHVKANHDDVLRQGRQREAENREKRNAQKRAAGSRYRSKHPDRKIAQVRRWQIKNPDRWRAIQRVAWHNRRAKKKGNGGRFSISDVEAMFERQQGACAYCPSTDDLEIDHVIPVSKGGSSDPSNLQLLCLPCNRRKGNKIVYACA